MLSLISKKGVYAALILLLASFLLTLYPKIHAQETSNSYVVVLKPSNTSKILTPQQQEQARIKEIDLLISNLIPLTSDAINSTQPLNKINYKYTKALLGFSGLFTEEAITYFRQSDKVKYIVPIKPYDTAVETTNKLGNIPSQFIKKQNYASQSLYNSSPTQGTQSNVTPNLDVLDQKHLYRTGENKYLDERFVHGIDGSGVNAYLISGNADDGHLCSEDPRFEDVDKNGASFPKSSAGLIGGAQFGVAKNVNLQWVKSPENCETGFSNLLARIDYLAKNHVRPSVVNFTMQIAAFPQPWGELWPILIEAVEGLEKSGAVVVSPAGNSDYICKSVSDRILVANGGDVDGWTNGNLVKGGCIDIVAPASSTINGFAPTDSSLGAEAHVTGAIALLLRQFPDSTPSQIRELLYENATRMKIGASGLGEKRFLYVDAVQNLALTQGTASQSSRNNDSLAENAINGDKNSNSITNIEYQPWWQVELTHTDYIENAVIYSSGTLTDAYLLASEKPIIGNSLNEIINHDPNIFYQRLSNKHVESVEINHQAKYIKIKILNKFASLSLTEVELYGHYSQDNTPKSNLALEGKASQIITDRNGYAALAIDGNTDGNFESGSLSHTAETVDPWWNLDLIHPAEIDRIFIYNRSDCCNERLEGAYLMVSSTPFEGTVRQQIYGNSEITKFYLSDLAVQEFPVRHKGQYIRIAKLTGSESEVLSLAEVEVWGNYIETEPEKPNIAPEGTASQIAAGWGGHAFLAIDENTNGLFANQSVTHSSLIANPWWNLDFDVPAHVDEIIIYNRTDCCSERLDGAYLMVSSAPFMGSVSQQMVDPSISKFRLRNEAVQTISIGQELQYIRIAKSEGDGRTILSLAEVKVLGEFSDIIPKPNIASDGSASQIATGWGGHADRAIDGNTDGQYNNGSVTNSSKTANPWWNLDFDIPATIDRITIHNRIDCCSERLDGAYLMVSPTPFTGGVAQQINDPSITKFRLSGQSIQTILVELPAQYIRIAKPTNAEGTILSLAEVEVFGEFTDVLPKPNIASKGTATQIATGWGGQANRAIDGNPDGQYNNGSVTNSSQIANPWWNLDFDIPATIDRITIHNRTDCCSERLDGAYLMVSPTPFTGSVTQQIFDASIIKFRLSGQSLQTIPIGKDIQYIRIAKTMGNERIVLSLAEVEVFGEFTDAKPKPNIALTGTASQIATGFGGTARRAIDGNTDGQYNNASVTHSSKIAKPWWNLDLRTPATINRITIHNRTDCCAERLEGAYLMVSPTPFTGGVDQQINDPNISKFRLSNQNIQTVLINKEARYIRIAKSLGNEKIILSLAEVEVFGDFVHQ